MKRAERKNGFILPAIMAIVLIIAIMAMTVMTLAQHQITLTRIEADRVRAFYLAEAGVAKIKEQLYAQQVTNLTIGNHNKVLSESLGYGQYNVAIDTSTWPYKVTATGKSNNVTKKIQADAVFLSPALEHAIYGQNSTGVKWDFQLRGKGSPVSVGPFGKERGGKDQINGNIFVDGNVHLFEESSINAAPAPNIHTLKGDAKATGKINIKDSSSVAGTTFDNSEAPAIVSLAAMDYEHNNTHNVAQIFKDEGVSSGYLPKKNELRNVFVKNPSDRTAECKTTSGDDYFFEPSSGFVTGGPKTGDTPLDAGENRVYYIDGNVWIHSYPTYGFKMKGKVTIVATGDIHICDNLQYKDKDSILGLVALGKYNEDGKLASGGNIRFGDAIYGNMGMFSAMMFAANDFTFNTNRITNRAAEPDSGFTINGNFAAMGKIDIQRDWYNKGTEKRCTYFDPQINKWVDSETKSVLTSSEVNSLRHYQMIVNYDERVRNPETQPPGLPLGGLKIFAGLTNWKEL